MKKKSFFINCISLLLVLGIICVFGSFTVFAEPNDENPDIVAQPDNNNQENLGNPPVEGAPENPPAENPDQNQQEQQEPPAENPEQQPPMYEYIYGYSEDATTSYEKPQYLDDLPEVSSEQVVEATAVAVPDVAVSDASLFSGIVMWLCVALGIAVIVGVLVSRRTRRGV